MPIVDETGRYKTDGSLQPEQSVHPVWKARNEIALPKGKWLYGGDDGHELDQYTRAKGTIDKAEEFQKAATLYLEPYGPQVTSRLLKPGTAKFSIDITRETVNG